MLDARFLAWLVPMPCLSPCGCYAPCEQDALASQRRWYGFVRRKAGRRFASATRSTRP
jgi:hypothetical protein